MATKEQIESVLEKLEKSHPVDFFKKVNEIQMGIGAVLRLLYESNEVVTAGKISDVLNISTARVAVLLKKMVVKGLITKEQSITDARVTVVKLTEVGEETVFKMRDEMFEQMGRVIDAIGEERILEFLAISSEIRTIAKEPEFKF